MHFAVKVASALNDVFTLTHSQRRLGQELQLLAIAHVLICELVAQLITICCVNAIHMVDVTVQCDLFQPCTKTVHLSQLIHVIELSVTLVDSSSLIRLCESIHTFYSHSLHVDLHASNVIR